MRRSDRSVELIVDRLNCQDHPRQMSAEQDRVPQENRLITSHQVETPRLTFQSHACTIPDSDTSMSHHISPSHNLFFRQSLKFQDIYGLPSPLPSIPIQKASSRPARHAFFRADVPSNSNRRIRPKTAIPVPCLPHEGSTEVL